MVLICPQGHRWEASDECAGERQHACPECGAAHVTVSQVQETPLIPAAAGTPTVDLKASPADTPTTDQKSKPATPSAGMPTVPGHEVLRVLGRGGMGVVYQARHIQLKRLVALKMILAGDHAGPEHLARFRLEAEAVARLHHPNIVQVYEVGETGGLPYFSLEYVEGGSLAQKLAGAPQSPRVSAELVEALARGMHAAHLQGIVHRDLKPANILLTGVRSQGAGGRNQESGVGNQESPVPKITDFGLAKQIHEDSGQTRSGAIMGTPSYMAPEQAAGLGKAIGPAADIYALGAILYEMLTGRPPFRGATLLDTMEQVRTQEPVPPSRLQPKVPRDLETICLKSLEKEPRQRYASAHDLADDLRRYLNQEPIKARPVGAGERLWKWARRRPAAAGLVVVVAGALVGLLSGILWNDAQTRRHNRELEEENRRTVLAEKDAREKGELAESKRTEAEQQRLEAIEKGELAETRRQDAVAKGELARIKSEEAEQQKKIAEKEAKENRERSVRLTVATGQRLLKEGDLPGSLLYAVEALHLDDPLGPESDRHRLRLTAALQQAPRFTQVFAHARAVTQAAFSPDGRWVLTASQDGTARVWDTASGKALGTQPLKHDAAVNCAIFSPDGKRVLTGSDDHTARVWDTYTGQPLSDPLNLGRPVIHVAYAPDGQRLLAVSGTRFLSTASNNPTMREQRIPLGPGPGGVMRFTTIYVPQYSGPRAYGHLQILDADGKPVGKRMVHPGWINQAAFSPDGQFVVVATGHLDGPSSAQVRDVETGERVTRQFKHAGHVNQAIYSPDGQRLVTASGTLERNEGEARLWDAATGEPIGRPLKHAGQVTHAWFSPDGRRVLTASWDGTARVWDAESCEPLTPPLVHKGRLAGAWFSPDGRLVLSAGQDGSARVWDAFRGEPVIPYLRHGSQLSAAAFSPDGHRLVTAGRDGSVRLWDLVTPAYRSTVVVQHGSILPRKPREKIVENYGKTQRTLEILGDLNATSAVFSPDSRYLFTSNGTRMNEIIPGGGSVSGFLNNHLCLWDVATGQAALVPLPHAGLVTNASLSPDGRRVLTVERGATVERGVNLWEVPARKRMVQRPLDAKEQFKAAAFAPEGRAYLVTAAKLERSWEVRVVDVENGLPVVPPLEHEGPVEQAVLSADAGTLATLMTVTVGRDKKAPKLEWVTTLWDLKTGKRVGQPLKQTVLVSKVALSADGKHAVTYSPGKSAFASGVDDAEGEALLWQAGTDKTVALRHAGAILYATFSQDGRSVATASADHTARVWEVPGGRPLTAALEHQGKVSHVAFGPGNVVVTSSHDRTARLWELPTGELLAPPLRHTDWVLHAAFSADGRRLVTAGCDGTALIWDLALDRRAVGDLRELAQVLADHRLDARGGLTALDAATFDASWKKLSARFPADFAVPAAAVNAWRRAQADEAEKAGDWSATRIHLDALIAAEPGQWWHHARRAGASVRLDQWDKAHDDYARAVEFGAASPLVGYRLAVLQAHLGKTDDYRRSCAVLMTRLGQDRDPEAAGVVLRTCLLLPDALADLKPLVTLAEEIRPNKDKKQLDRALGQALYRAGRFEEAAQQLKDGTGRDGLFLAMSLQRSNRAGEARTTLDKVLGALPAENTPAAGRLPWFERLELKILRQEAEKLVK